MPVSGIFACQAVFHAFFHIWQYFAYSFAAQAAVVRGKCDIGDYFGIFTLKPEKFAYLVYEAFVA